MAARFELTKLQKADGAPLTKHIELDAEGRITNDSSACGMSRGTAERFQFDNAEQLAAFIAGCQSDQAFALGRLRSDLVDTANVVTKKNLNGAAPGTIARTKDYIGYRDGAPAWGVIDFDRKGMSLAVVARLSELGDLVAALSSVCPEIARTTQIIRASASAGIRRSDTGESFDGIGGVHIYFEVRDGSYIPRFLKTLHERCWLAGLGWYVLDIAGRLLERSIVDRMVGSPERLQFEGPPQLDSPLVQDTDSRRPQVIAGVPLDTATTCPPLAYDERARLERLQADTKAQLKPEAARVREAYIAARAPGLAARAGISVAEAKKILVKQCDNTLFPDLILPFDDPELEGCTVADVLDDPERFHEATLADPVEGIGYGPNKAQLYCNADGSIVIHSFAHGGINYRLRRDYRNAATVLQNADVDDTAELFRRIIREDDDNDLDPIETELLRNMVHEITGIGKRTLDKIIKAERQAQTAARKAEMREHRIAEAASERVVLDRPADDAEWLPLMNQIGEILDNVEDTKPPARDIEHDGVGVRERRLKSLHLLTSETVNLPEEEPKA